MGLDFIRQLSRDQQEGAVNLVMLFNNLTPVTLTGADLKDFYPRDTHFLERLLRLAKIDPQICNRVRLVRQKLLKIQEGVDNPKSLEQGIIDPIPLVQRDLDTIIETAWTSFYDTGLYIPGLTCGTLDLDCGYIGGNLDLTYTTINGDFNYRGIVVTGKYLHRGMQVAGRTNKMGSKILGLEDPDELTEEDLEMISQSIRPPAAEPKIPAPPRAPAETARTPRAAAPVARGTASQPKRSLRPAAKPKPSLRPAAKPAAPKPIADRPKPPPKPGQTRTHVETADIDVGWGKK